ncbi:MAG TPA: YIP1 family protein [Verrucomicrobiae bacterium]|jgi:hypothetical protein
MDSSPTTPTPDSAPIEPSSLMDRLTNVIASPGEVFSEVSNSPVRASNWFVPLLLSCICTVIYIFMAFSQPAVLQGMAEQRQAAMQKKVASGKITQAQADQAAAMTEKFLTPTMLKVFGAGGAAVGSVAGLFLMALIIWFGLKIFGGSGIDYMKVVEIYGLSLVIDVPQKLLRVLLVSWKGNLLATASPTLFMANPSATNRTDVFLSMIDVIDIWWLAVLSLGLSKATSISYRNAALVTFVVWYGFRIILTLLTVP